MAIIPPYKDWVATGAFDHIAKAVRIAWDKAVPADTPVEKMCEIAEEVAREIPRVIIAIRPLSFS